jgi:PAS domain S-box-containing protein
MSKTLNEHPAHTSVAIIFPALMVLISIMVLGGLFAYQSAQDTQLQLRQYLGSLASLSASQVNPNYVDYLINTTDPLNTPVFKKLSEILVTIRQQVPLADNVYILHKTDDPLTLAFVLDADTLTPIDSLDTDGDGEISKAEAPSYPGDFFTITPNSVLIQEAFVQTAVEPDFTTSKWGTFLSGYAPIKGQDGSTIAVLGLDMPANNFNDIARKNLLPMLGMFAALAILLSLLTARIAQRRVEQQRRLLRLMSNVPGMVYRDDKGFNDPFEFVTDKAESLTGYSVDELSGEKGKSYRFFIHPEDQDAVENTIKTAIAERKQFEITYRIITKEGHEKWVWEQGRGVYAGKKLKAVEGFVIDVSEQKHMEETKANFMTITSHMLRTPISGVRWSLEALQDDQANLNEEQQELINNAHESSVHLTEYLNSILRTTSFNAGVKDVELEMQSLSPVLAKVIASFKEPTRARGQYIEFACDPDIKVAADSTFLEKVMDTLIGNAVMYSDDRGKITVKGTTDDRHVIVSIHNLGKIIPVAEQTRVFQQFFRGSQGLEAQPDGTGLGLYTAKTIVTMLQGSIGFTSNEEEGTTFVVRLPKVS